MFMDFSMFIVEIKVYFYDFFSLRNIFGTFWVIVFYYIIVFKSTHNSG